jgi:hypothetical protein
MIRNEYAALSAGSNDPEPRAAAVIMVLDGSPTKSKKALRGNFSARRWQTRSAGLLATTAQLGCDLTRIPAYALLINVPFVVLTMRHRLTCNS